MTIDSRRIESIVGEVLQRLEATGRGADTPGIAPLGIVVILPFGRAP